MNNNLAIEELAECIKEIVRLIQSFPTYGLIPVGEQQRWDYIYKKATTAKARV